MNERNKRKIPGVPRPEEAPMPPPPARPDSPLEKMRLLKRHFEPQDTWRRLIAEEMEAHGETLDGAASWSVTACQDPKCPCQDNGGDLGWLDQPFSNGYGEPRGHSFRMWTTDRVYFPHVYDGNETCRSAPRHPGAMGPRDDEHVGVHQEP